MLIMKRFAATLQGRVADMPASRRRWRFETSQVETLCIHNIRQRQRYCGGRKTRPGGLSTPGRGQGEGPVGDKFPKGTQDTMGGAGMEREARNGVPRTPPSLASPDVAGEREKCRK